MSEEKADYVGLQTKTDIDFDHEKGIFTITVGGLNPSGTVPPPLQLVAAIGSAEQDLKEFIIRAFPGLTDTSKKLTFSGLNSKMQSAFGAMHFDQNFKERENEDAKTKG